MLTIKYLKGVTAAKGTIQRFDRAAAKEVLAEIQKLLEPLKSRGIIIRRCGGDYYDTLFKVRLEMIACPTGNMADVEKREWEMRAPLLGFEGKDFGREFTYRGRTYTIAGIRLQRKKYPILAQSENGKTRLFTPEAVKGAWS